MAQSSTAGYDCVQQNTIAASTESALMNTRHWWWLIAGLLALLLAACDTGDDSGIAKPPYRKLYAEGPPCAFTDWVPWHNLKTTCLEVVYDHVVPPTAAPALAGLAFGPEGTLYVVHTAAGEIWAMPDRDGDQFLDDPELIAAGLRFPTQLTFHEEALYVVGADGLLRLGPDPDPDGAGGFGAPVRLVDDLGGDRRFWSRAVRVGSDDRLYVGLGGEVASFALDGSDRRTEATGLRYATGLAWHPTTGDLWIADSRGADTPYDTLFRVPVGTTTPPDFGYPACLDYDPESDACVNVTPPAHTFEDQSAPVGLAFYPGGEWHFWDGYLMVALGGSWNRVEPSGYALAVVGVDEAGDPTVFMDRIAPASGRATAQLALAGFSLADRGFYPEHPSGIALSAEGWLYVATQEGRIYRARPRPEAVAE